jgi:transcriptional regulator with XRE-family HTH domain
MNASFSRKERGRAFPNCLRRYRRARGLTQKEVAKILGLKSTSIISRWERGVSLPSVLNLFKLAVLYRTMADALFIDLRRALQKELFKREAEILGDKTKGQSGQKEENRHL